jgi:TetR/AcrR family transcriptional regulator, fatty acid metabolism regulator protein
MARSRSIEETRRELIVDSALRLILKNGYDRTTLDHVAAQAGVSKGLISYYFPNKDALFLAVLDKIHQRLRQDLESCYRADLPARDRLRLNLRNLFGSEKRARQYYVVLLDFLARVPREKSIQVGAEAIYQTVLTYVEWTIIDGIRSGEFREVDSREEASVVVALMEGLILQWLFNRQGHTLEEAYQLCERYISERIAVSAENGVDVSAGVNG